MAQWTARAVVLAIVVMCGSSATVAQKDRERLEQKRAEASGPSVLWTDPVDISTRNLFYGEGGANDAPTTTSFTYLKEDLDGTNPKFDVRDENGVKWRVKLGEEARPEVVATRLLWSVGYFANEEYFLPKIHVDGMKPVSAKRRKRVRGLIDSDGTMYNVELKRDSKDEKKIGEWKWRHNPFTGTRGFNGLRVMMAVLNNWDLKDENNAVYAIRTANAPNSGTADDPLYLVSDVGATFGTAGRVRKREIAKGNLNSYRRSKFIRKVTAQYVDFAVPAREPVIMAVNPKEFVQRIHLRWIGRRIPRADARWIGQLLAQLSPDQIRDAFRAAGYSPEEVDTFASIVSERISELIRL